VARLGRFTGVTSLATLVLASAVFGEPVTAQSTEPHTPPARRPNLLVIITDDQRAETMHVMPRTRRWFEARGTSFTNAYITTPLCCPSRASFFTGQFAHNHGVLTNEDALKLDQRGIVQRYLKRHGYRTAIIGKYLNRWGIKRNPPHFDRWVVPVAGYEDLRFNVNGTRRRIRGYVTDILANHAVQQITQFARTDRPWLMFITPFAPHGPFIPAPRHRRARVGAWGLNPAVRDVERIGKPEDVLERPPFPYKTARRVRRQQLRTLLAVDQLVGRVMREVARTGQADDTLSIFTSDNGYFWGEFGLFDKRRPYEPAYRVPMYLRWPGRIAADADDDRIVANIDVAPTFLDVAGIDPSPDIPMDGRSLVREHGRERMLLEYFPHPRQPPRRAWASIRTETAQYTEYYADLVDGEEDVVWFREYYDVMEDPWSLVNLLEDGNPDTDPSPGELDVLTRWLSSDRACVGTTGPTACP
jgi:arylsulfatase A-like enzyme